MIDSHAHLNDERFDLDWKEVINRALDNGVGSIINISEDPVSFLKALNQIKSYDYLYTTMGRHPHKADHFCDEELNMYQDYVKHPQVKAIGEIGLDYFYKYSNPENQKKVFKAYLNFAKKNKLPVIIHCREAETDMMQILNCFSSKELTGVIHCFTGTLELAQFAVKMGFFISFSGIITFKNAEDLRCVAKKIDLDHILIETDSPYLAPIPYRGHRNEPAYVKYVGEALASIKDISIDQVLEKTTSNTQKLFQLTSLKASL